MARYDASMEAMVEMYIFETAGLLEQLDEILLNAEKRNVMGEEEINEIFRIMHTIKGSSAMMGLENMSVLAHVTEDMFFLVRENTELAADSAHLYELVFEATDLFKAELDMIQDNDSEPTDFTPLMDKIRSYIEVLKNGGTPPPEAETESASVSIETEAVATPVAVEEVSNDVITVRVFFDDDCQMENLRAFILYTSIKEDCSFIECIPSDVETNPESAKVIINDGFIVNFTPYDNADMVLKAIESALNVKSYEVIENENIGETVEATEAIAVETPAPVAVETVTAVVEEKPIVVAEAPKPAPAPVKKPAPAKPANNGAGASAKQSLISVNLKKLDLLLDMVGEIVITEAMVISNPDLKGLKLENFSKAARQLRKLTDELQDIVMSIRMVPLSGVFNKMSRIVRDMNIKLGKDVELIFEGEDTEVDKTIIDNLNDPLMHMVRNAMDHGIETAEEKANSGKAEKSRITLSAYNASSEVVIVVADNGKGINPEKVLEKAKKNGILTKPEEDYTENEINNLIMAPGFSTNENVTEFSGRGVGMDVVNKNIEKVGGTVNVFSKFGEGSNMIIRIPLSLAIVDAMEVSVGESIFAIPINTIKESFKIRPNQLLLDTEKGEMILIRGECYPLIRLDSYYGIDNAYQKLEDGIIMLVESDGKSTCIFVDELVGEQQVVVKPFSPILNRFNVKKYGMAGCSVLGDGSITIILDINSILSDY